MSADAQDEPSILCSDRCTDAMTAQPHLVDLARNATAPSEAVLHFLQLSARLLLEYNVRSKSIERRIDRMAQFLDVRIPVSYTHLTLPTILLV